MLAPQSAADILVLEADPREDVRNVARIELVVSGGAVRRRGDLDEMLSQLQKETRVERPIVDAFVRGEPKAALAALAELGSTLVDSSARSLAMRFAQQGQHGEAREALGLGLRAHPESWSAHQLAGRALLVDGDVAGALTELRDALSRAPAAARASLRVEIEALAG